MVDLDPLERVALMGSEVDDPPIRVKHGLVHGLRIVGCGKTVLHQLRLGRFRRFRDDVALDEFGHLGADHVRAEQFAGAIR